MITVTQLHQQIRKTLWRKFHSEEDMRVGRNYLLPMRKNKDDQIENMFVKLTDAFVPEGEYVTRFVGKINSIGENFGKEDLGTTIIFTFDDIVYCYEEQLVQSN